MRRLTTRPDRAPVTGPAAWFIRFVGVDGVIGPLGFGGFTIPAIISVAQGRGIIHVWGNPTYGDGPFERIGIPTTVPLLAGFLAACLVQLVAATAPPCWNASPAVSFAGSNRGSAVIACRSGPSPHAAPCPEASMGDLSSAGSTAW